MSEGMRFWEAARFISENPRRCVFADIGECRIELHFRNGELQHTSGGRIMTFSHSMLDATWHVVESEAERVKREHYELLILARDVAGPKPWNKGEIVPRGTTFARNVLEKLGLD